MDVEVIIFVSTGTSGPGAKKETRSALKKHAHRSGHVTPSPSHHQLHPLNVGIPLLSGTPASLNSFIIRNTLLHYRLSEASSTAALLLLHWGLDGIV